MASTSIRFLSALLLHSRSQGGWSQSQLSRVTVGNNLDESPSHRRATIRQTAIAAILTATYASILGCGWRLCRKSTTVSGIKPTTVLSCGSHCTTVLVWNPFFRSWKKKNWSAWKCFRYSALQLSVQVQVIYSNQLFCDKMKDEETNISHNSRPQWMIWLQSRSYIKGSVANWTAVTWQCRVSMNS